VKHIHLALMDVALGAAAVAPQPPARSFDLLITNARIIDGTGGPSITGSVAPQKPSAERAWSDDLATIKVR
jgi:hypothetical protein